jgi:integrase
MMRVRLDNSRYEFSFHDLRATFGLNMVDTMTANETKYTRALDQLRQLMRHVQPSTTERYYRADPSARLEVLEAVTPPKLRSGRFKATDALIASLMPSSVMRRGERQI